MDNLIDFIKSVEIKHFLKMTGYKINLPFEAEIKKFLLTTGCHCDILIRLIRECIELQSHGSQEV